MTTEHEHEWKELGTCRHSVQTAVYAKTAFGCACGATAHRTDVFACGIKRKKSEQQALHETQAAEFAACPAVAHIKAHRGA